MIALRPFHVWALLVAATVLAWLLAEGTVSRLASSAIILIAAFKINLVISQFMELKRHHRPYRLVLGGWLVLVSVIIIGGLWIA